MAGAMALTVVLYVAVRVMTDFTLFPIEKVEIRGNVRTSNETLMHALNLSSGQSIFSAKVEELSERTLKLPWVKSAKIQRRIPDTITIELEEWEPAFLVRLDKLYYMTKDAHVINAPLTMGLDYTIITGLTWNRLEEPGTERERVLAALLALSSGGFGDRVDEVNFDQTLGVTVYADGVSPYGVFFGFGDINGKFARLGQMRRTLEKRKVYAVSADFSFEDRIVARLAPLPQEGERGGTR